MHVLAAYYEIARRHDKGPRSPLSCTDKDSDSLPVTARIPLSLLDSAGF